jgi:hypothetical protein
MPPLVMGMKNTQWRIDHLNWCLRGSILGKNSARARLELLGSAAKQASYLDSDEVPTEESMAVAPVPLRLS